MQGDTVGFRVKLAVDPEYDLEGSFGAEFADSYTSFLPQLVIDLNV
jgi:hypothetical protein